MKTILYVVDVQNDFMLPDGKLYVKDAEKIIPNIKKSINWAKSNSMQIIYSADYHFDNSSELSETPDFINTFPKHCMSYNDGWKIVDGIGPLKPQLLHWNDIYSLTELELHYAKSKSDLVILKDKFDVFEGNPNTESLIKFVNPDVVYIIGVVETICVKQAVDGFLRLGKKVIVIEDCIKNLDAIPSCKEEWLDNGVYLMNSSDLKI